MPSHRALLGVREWGDCTSRSGLKMDWTGWVACYPMSATCVLDWSAIATAAAAFAALIVGFLPRFLDRWRRSQAGKAEALIAATDLTSQAIYLGAGLELLQEETASHGLFQIALEQMRALDSSSCRLVLPYLDCLPNSLRSPLSSVIANIQVGHRVLKRAPDPGPGQCAPTGPIRDVYQGVFTSIDEARKALYEVAGRRKIEDVRKGVAVVASQFRKEAAKRDIPPDLQRWAQKVAEKAATEAVDSLVRSKENAQDVCNGQRVVEVRANHSHDPGAEALMSGAFGDGSTKRATPKRARRRKGKRG